MAMRAENWVGEYTSTVGGGDIVLGGPIDGFCGFANAGDNVDVYYTIMDGSNKETGIGTVVSGSLIRKTIHAVLLDGSYIKGGSPLQLSGDAQVYLTANASFMDQIQSIDEDLAQTIAQVSFLSQNAILAGGPRDQQITEDIQNVSVVFVNSNPPLDPPDGKRWFDTTSGRTYIYYNDGDTKQWVEDNPQNNSVVDQSALIRSIADGSFGAFSHRNKIINGKMEISQRGTSFTAASGYTIDRWMYASNSSAVVTISAQNDAPANSDFQNSLHCVVTTADAAIAASDVAYICQIIEGHNVRDLLKKTFTLSFWVKSSKVGVHCVALMNSVDNRDYIAEYAIHAANTWEKKTITVTGGLTNTGTWNFSNGRGLYVSFIMACGATYQTAPNTWQVGTFRSTANQVNCLDTAGNVFAITGVQLEVGESASPFEHRPIGIELSLCQRYYNVIAFPIGGDAYNSNVASGNTLVFPTPMRSTPNISVKPGATSVNVSNFIHDLATNTSLRTISISASAGQWNWNGSFSLDAEL